VGPEDADYWERARHVSGELMATVFGEWRRAASPCSGGIVLWLRDLEAGAGWGILDHEGRPKVAWHHLRRALAPVAVWLVDEGLNGIAVHVANDSAMAIAPTLRLALYRDEEVLVGEAAERLELAPRSTLELDAEAVLGRFVDVSYAYRFGAIQQDTVVATLETPDEVLSQAFLYPARTARLDRRSAAELGLAGALRDAGGVAALDLSSARVVRGIRLRGGVLAPADDGFDLEPGRVRSIALRGDVPAEVRVTALNLSEPLVVRTA
jgi:beta-mannosidase